MTVEEIIQKEMERQERECAERIARYNKKMKILYGIRRVLFFIIGFLLGFTLTKIILTLL